MKKFILTLSIILGACGYQSKEQKFFQKFTSTLGAKGSMKLSEIVDFNFDEVCIFQLVDSATFYAADLLKDDINKKKLQTSQPLKGKYFILSYRESKKIIKNYHHNKPYFDINGKSLTITTKLGQRTTQFCGDKQTTLTVKDTNILISDHSSP